jgi:hypothetical protein
MNKLLREFLRRAEGLGVEKVGEGTGGKHKWVILRSPGGRELKVMFSRGTRGDADTRATMNRLAEIRRWVREEVD